MDDDLDHWQPKLRSDDEFDTAAGNRRATFDGDRIGALFDPITAGAAVKFTPEELRDWLCADDVPDDEQALAIADAIFELNGLDTHLLLAHCGGSPRELARFLRRAGRPIHWQTVSILNDFTRSGNEPPPIEIDKRAAAGHFL